MIDRQLGPITRGIVRLIITMRYVMKANVIARRDGNIIKGFISLSPRLMARTVSLRRLTGREVHETPDIL